MGAGRRKRGSRVPGEVLGGGDFEEVAAKMIKSGLGLSLDSWDLRGIQITSRRKDKGKRKEGPYSKEMLSER